MRSVFQSSTLSLAQLLVLVLCWTPAQVSAATATAYDTSASGGASATTAKALPRRERNIDFFDANTFAFYFKLDPVTGEPLSKKQQQQLESTDQHLPNVAVMFYAQWDRNSHALAPAWDAMATKMNAGTKKAKLIMALFDCEVDNQHLQLCHAAGVTHYPAVMFASATRRFPHKPKVGSKGKAPPHVSIFPGHWQYDRSIMDWLRTMQGLSSWSAFWNKNGNKRKKWWQKQMPDPSMMLPVGVPLTAAAAATSSPNTGAGATTSAYSAGGSAQQQQQIKELSDSLEAYDKAVTRSSIMVNAMLFPEKDPVQHNSTDVYAYLNEHQGWDSKNDHYVVVRSCAMEMALDYCSRLMTSQTEELVQKRTQANNLEGTVEELEKELKGMVATAEPYCELIEPCIIDGFTSAECRTLTCPFQQDVACRYMTSCFDEAMQAEYAEALGLATSGKAGAVATGSAREESATGAGGTKQKRGWF